jgi:hypothetical protein
MAQPVIFNRCLVAVFAVYAVIISYIQGVRLFGKVEAWVFALAMASAIALCYCVFRYNVKQRIACRSIAAGFLLIIVLWVAYPSVILGPSTRVQICERFCISRIRPAIAADPRFRRVEVSIPHQSRHLAIIHGNVDSNRDLWELRYQLLKKCTALPWEIDWQVDVKPDDGSSDPFICIRPARVNNFTPAQSNE